MRSAAEEIGSRFLGFPWAIITPLPPLKGRGYPVGVRRVFVSFVLAFAAGCGGSVNDGEIGVTVPRGLDAGGGRPSTLDAGPRGGAPGTGGATASGGTTYRDPSCPPVTSQPGNYQCDPFSLTSCGDGNRCAPYVEYADNCGTEKIGTMCTIAGPGVQGDDCTVVTCSAGYVCATGGIGFVCMKLCQPGQSSDACAPGLICSELDVSGFYVCD